MKSQAVTIKTRQPDSFLESMIHQGDTELKEQAISNAKLFAERNLPAPKGDVFAHYVDEIKRGYEKLAAKVTHYLKPDSHLSEGKMDYDAYKEKDANLEKEINVLKDQNANRRHILGDFHPGSFYTQIRWAVICSLIIIFGEILFNTKAFQVTGESLLFALILSISISFTVLFFSHLAAFLYKAAKNRSQRWLVISVSLLIVTAVFTALAIFRSKYLASHDIHIHPIYFVIINLFFFIVASLISYFILPTLQELRENAIRLKQYRIIQKDEKKIEKLSQEKEGRTIKILDSSKGHVYDMHSAQYANDLIKKMCKEAIAVFKGTNLKYRTDRQMPDCFSQVIPEPDIPDLTFNLKNSNRK